MNKISGSESTGSEVPMNSNTTDLPSFGEQLRAIRLGSNLTQLDVEDLSHEIADSRGQVGLYHPQFPALRNRAWPCSSWPSQAHDTRKDLQPQPRTADEVMGHDKRAPEIAADRLGHSKQRLSHRPCEVCFERKNVCCESQRKVCREPQTKCTQQSLCCAQQEDL